MRSLVFIVEVHVEFALPIEGLRDLCCVPAQVQATARLGPTPITTNTTHSVQPLNFKHIGARFVRAVLGSKVILRNIEKLYSEAVLRNALFCIICKLYGAFRGMHWLSDPSNPFSC